MSGPTASQPTCSATRHGMVKNRATPAPWWAFAPVAEGRSHQPGACRPASARLWATAFRQRPHHAPTATRPPHWPTPLAYRHRQGVTMITPRAPVCPPARPASAPYVTTDLIPMAKSYHTASVETTHVPGPSVAANRVSVDDCRNVSFVTNRAYVSKRDQTAPHGNLAAVSWDHTPAAPRLPQPLARRLTDGQTAPNAAAAARQGCARAQGVHLASRT